MSSEVSYHLYHYWRSSASWRVRIAFEWKGLKFKPTHVGLLDGESESPAHLKRNPSGFVPVLELEGGKNSGALITESFAIIRYLEETHPETPTLFPGSALDRAHILAIAETMNSGIQPLHNIPTFERHSSDPEEQKRWSTHFILKGLEVLEKLASQTSGKFLHGDQFSLADLCLIPQAYGADRYQISLDQYPTLRRVHETCKSMPAILNSHPDRYKPLT